MFYGFDEFHGDGPGTDQVVTFCIEQTLAENCFVKMVNLSFAKFRQPATICLGSFCTGNARLTLPLPPIRGLLFNPGGWLTMNREGLVSFV